jgi:hypothetical protein
MIQEAGFPVAGMVSEHLCFAARPTLSREALSPSGRCFAPRIPVVTVTSHRLDVYITYAERG